jgi:hypothetical protein
MSIYISNNYLMLNFLFIILLPANSFLLSFYRSVGSFKFYFPASYRTSALSFLVFM